MIAGSLPPSSRVTRFRLSAALAMTFLPVAVEPVKVMRSMPGCSVIQRPRSLPPATTLRHAGGQHVARHLAEQQRRERRIGRGLQHHRVAGIERLGDLVGAEHDREIPRRDAADHAHRMIDLLDPVGLIDAQGLVLHLQIGEGASSCAATFISNLALDKGLPCSLVRTIAMSSAFASTALANLCR